MALKWSKSAWDRNTDTTETVIVLTPEDLAVA
jgi:hypothetical protein